MNTHYQTLGVPEQASADDIRRAYRRLVLLTHPDRTPDPAAHAQYLAVNDAYEVLSSPRRRASYDALLWALRNPPPPRPAADQARRRRMAARPPVVRPRPLSTQERYAVQYARLFRWLRPLMLVSVLLSGSLLLDWLLARQQAEQIRVLGADVYYTGGKYPEPHVYFVHETSAGVFYSDSAVAAGETVLVRRTPIWHKALQVRRPAARQLIETDTIYAGFTWLVPLGLGLLAALTLWPRLNLDYRLGFGLCSVLLLCISIYEMLHR